MTESTPVFETTDIIVSMVKIGRHLYIATTKSVHIYAYREETLFEKIKNKIFGGK